MAYIMTHAGGLAFNGTAPILDIVPDSIHQRCPIFLGSRDDVEDVMQIIKKYKK
jgi:fructose-1,6-bisphosphatase I